MRPSRAALGLGRHLPGMQQPLLVASGWHWAAAGACGGGPAPAPLRPRHACVHARPPAPVCPCPLQFGSAKDVVNLAGGWQLALSQLLFKQWAERGCWARTLPQPQLGLAESHPSALAVPPARPQAWWRPTSCAATTRLRTGGFLFRLGIRLEGCRQRQCPPPQRPAARILCSCSHTKSRFPCTHATLADPHLPMHSSRDQHDWEAVAAGPDTAVIDVREPGELKAVSEGPG